MRFTIDPHRCNGHGRCYGLAPAVFDADADGRGMVIVDLAEPDQVAAARLAVANCPEQAILLGE